MDAAKATAEAALEHAAADLAAKEQEVKRDQAIAESIATLATEQQGAAEAIAQQAGNLEQMAADNQGMPPTAAQQSAAQKLNEAQAQFADAQQATGQGAVELSGQTEVANQPLRDALELASQLPELGPMGEMLADAGQPLPADGQPLPADGQPAEGQPAEGQPAGEGQPMPADGQATGKPQGPPGPPKNPAGLGTGFVPQSPQLTAQMMAGAQAQLAAQQAMAQAPPQGQPTGQPAQPGQPSQPAPTQAQEGQPTPAQPSNSSQLAKKDGQATTNQKVKDGPVQKQPEATDAGDSKSSKGREKEESVLARQLKDEAWFAKLPPELRKSIRAGAGQKPPRAYEDRLKKYFESVD